jgi:hypothetical protein
MWVEFRGPWNGKCWYIVSPSGIWYSYFEAIRKFCGHLVHFSPIWYIEPRKICQPWLLVLLIQFNEGLIFKKLGQCLSMHNAIATIALHL